LTEYIGSALDFSDNPENTEKEGERVKEI
jgi:hypothetical protein